MQVPANTRPILWGAVGGAVLCAIVGFTWGGWVTGGSARQQAAGSARDAVVAALAPICAERFRRPGRRRGAGCGARQVEFMGARRDRRKEPVCTHARQQDDRFRRGTRLRRDAGDSSSYQKLTLLRTERPRRQRRR